MQSNRRQVLLASGVALAGVGAVSGSVGGETSGAPAGDSGGHAYPTASTNSDAPVATVYGSFSCPYTEEMYEGSFADVLEEFVEPGRLQLAYCPLEYDDDGSPYISDNGVMAGQAACGVWSEDPGSFWDFFAELWAHMPGSTSRDELEDIMRSAGVDDAAYIADNLENWDSELRQAADDGWAEGVDFTPTIELHGDLGNRDNVVEWIEQRLDDDGGSDDTQEDAQEESTDDDQQSDGAEESGPEDDGSEADEEAEMDAGSEEGSSDADDTDDDRAAESDGDDGSDDHGGSDDAERDPMCTPEDGSGDGGSDARASQSFVFPEASGSRRSL